MTKPEDFQGGEQQNVAMRSETLYWRTHNAFAWVMDRCGISVVGQENIEELVEGQGAEVVMTHDSFLDVLGVAKLGLKRPIRLVGKHELRLFPPTRIVGDRVGVVWVDRKDKDSRSATVDKTIQLLDAGEIVGSFGGGTRNRSGDRRAVGASKTGPVRAAFMAKGTTQVLTVAFGFNKGIIRRNASPMHMGVAIGKPLPILHNPDFTEAEMRDKTAEIHEDLVMLKSHAVDLAESRG